MEHQAPSVFGQTWIKTVLTIVAIVVLAWFIFTVRGVLGPFVLAFVLAYVLTPLVDHMEGRGLNRTSSILVIFLVTFGVLVFGLVTLGKKLASEMVDLSVEFLRQESVDRNIMLINQSADTVTIDFKYGWTSSTTNPFTVTEPAEFPVVIIPSDSVSFAVQFAPPKAKLVWGDIRLIETGSGNSKFIRLMGNGSSNERTGFDAKYGSEFRWAGLTLSALGMDFGDAGPNIVSRLSAKAEDIEPLVQRYLGEEADIASQIKRYGSDLIEVLLGPDLLEGVTTDVLSGVASGVMLLVVVPFVAFFFLREGRRITHALIELVPNAYFEMVLNLIHQINGQIGGYIRGQLLAVSVVAGLAVFGLTLIGMPYALPVGVVAGLANMIPYLGPIIGIVSASIVALATQQGMDMVGQVIILFVIIQVVDNVLIQPLVVAKSVDLHPLVVLLVVMIGSNLMGIVGMLVAVPVTGILKVSSTTVYEGIKAYRLH